MTSHTAADRAASRRAALVVALCLAAAVVEGYDMVIFGAVVPALLDYEPWGLDASTVGTLASVGLFGMLVGASFSGPLTDAIGRRKVLIGTVTIFSASMALCAVAPSPELFGLFRFLGGIALGGVVPAAITVCVEFAPVGRRNFYNGLVQAGFGVGGVLAALLAVFLLTDHGFRLMFWIGAIPLVTVVPLALAFLPESIDYLNSRERFDEARAVARLHGRKWDEASARAAAEGRSSRSRTTIHTLLSRRHRRVTLLFIAIYFFALLLSYGLNTWLPQIMRTAGYPMGSSLSSLLLLSIGGVVGALLLSRLADRFGARLMGCSAFALAAVSMLVLSLHPSSITLAVALLASGVGAWGGSAVISGYVADVMPADLRGSMLGIGLGLGRLGAVVGPLMGGWVLASGLPIEWNFYAFMIPAVVAAVLILVVRASIRRGAVPAPPTGQPATAANPGLS